MVLANPPFAGKVQEESILSDLNHGINTRATELLFLKWFIDHLAPGGRAGVIVPNGVLFGANKAAKKLRQMLLKECDLQAVVSLPSGVFKPYSGVGTGVLVFQKGGPTKSVWFYDVTADGFSLDDKRTEVAANDLPDVVEGWQTRAKSAKASSVKAERINGEPDLRLIAARYSETEAGDSRRHEDPQHILADVLALQARLSQAARQLMEKLQQ